MSVGLFYSLKTANANGWQPQKNVLQDLNSHLCKWFGENEHRSFFFIHLFFFFLFFRMRTDLLCLLLNGEAKPKLGEMICANYEIIVLLAFHYEIRERWGKKSYNIFVFIIPEKCGDRNHEGK